MEKGANLQLEIEEISTESEGFETFLNDWSADIELYFPDFSIYDTTFATAFQLKIDEQPAGIFVYQHKGEELHIDLDYLIPEYRDQGIGKKFFTEKLNSFILSGVEIIIALSNIPSHQEYLVSLGFKRSEMYDSRFEIKLI